MRIPSSFLEASRRMVKVRQKGTGAEIALRRALFKMGLRSRVEFEVLRKSRGIADIAFPAKRIAVVRLVTIAKSKRFPSPTSTHDKN